MHTGEQVENKWQEDQAVVSGGGKWASLEGGG
jgi:hypothetical protein